MTAKAQHTTPSRDYRGMDINTLIAVCEGADIGAEKLRTALENAATALEYGTVKAQESADERAALRDSLRAALSMCDALTAERDRLRVALAECITYDGALAERNHTMACKRLYAISETARAALARIGG